MVRIILILNFYQPRDTLIINTQLRNMATIQNFMKEESIHKFILFESMLLIKINLEIVKNLDNNNKSSTI